MTDFVMGMATGMALNGITNTIDSGTLLKIELCKQEATQQEIQSCLLQIQKDNETNNTYLVCFFVLITILIFTYIWLDSR